MDVSYTLGQGQLPARDNILRERSYRKHLLPQERLVQLCSTGLLMQTFHEDSLKHQFWPH